MDDRRLIKIEQTPEGFFYELSPSGKRCQFLQFLINTSNFTWRKPSEEISQHEALKNNLALVSKLSAIGYLLQPIKDTMLGKAVIATNYYNECNFGTGKSLFARVLTMAASSVMINGRSFDLFQDHFLFREVSHQTKLVIIDDMEYNNFDPLYEYISSDWEVNIKGGIRFTIPARISPRILITRNKPINVKTPSLWRGSWHINFSDYYNKDRSPITEFGNAFESGWDREQLFLLNRLLTECIALYDQIGYHASFQGQLFHEPIDRTRTK